MQFYAILLVTVVLSFCGGLAAADAATPIPSDPKIPSIQKNYYNWLYGYLKSDIEAYKQKTKDPQKARPAGIKLLDEYLKDITNQPRDVLIGDHVALGSEAGFVQDSLALSIIGVNLANQEGYENSKGHQQHAVDEIQRAIRLLPQTKYGSRALVLAHIRLLAAMRIVVPRKVAWSCTDAVLNWIKSEGKNPAMRRYHWEVMHGMLLHYSLQDREVMTFAYLQLPQADPWIKEMIQGNRHYYRGMLARGTGVAAKVPPEAWKIVNEELQIAARHFQAAWKLDPTLPHSASDMISVANYIDVGIEPREWFDRTVQIEIDHPWAYESMMNYLLPRWGGSRAEMYRFGVECYQSKRYDTKIPALLVRCLLDIEAKRGLEAEVWRRKEIYEKVRDMYRNYEARENDPRPQRCLRMSEQIAAAYRAGDYDEALRVWKVVEKEFGGRIYLQILTNFHVDWPKALHHIHAATGEGKEEVAQVDEVLSNPSRAAPQELQNAVELLQRGRKKSKAPGGDPFFAYWISALVFQRQFEKGDWVELKSPAALKEGWLVRGGDWKPLDDRWVQFTRHAPDVKWPHGMGLELAARVFDSFEIEIEVEDVGSTKFIAGGGVAFGPLSYSPPNRLAPRPAVFGPVAMPSYFFAGPGSNISGWGRLGELSLESHRQVRAPATIRLKVWRGALECNYFDHHFIREIDRTFEPEGTIAYAIPWELTGNWAVKMRGRIRKLKYDPPPPQSLAADSDGYFSHVLLEEPDNISARYWRAVARMDLKRWDAAQDDLRTISAMAAKTTQNPSWLILSLLSKVCEEKNDLPAALDASTEALKHAPRHEWSKLKDTVANLRAIIGDKPGNSNAPAQSPQGKSGKQ